MQSNPVAPLKHLPAMGAAIDASSTRLPGAWGCSLSVTCLGAKVILWEERQVGSLGLTWLGNGQGIPEEEEVLLLYCMVLGHPHALAW